METTYPITGYGLMAEKHWREFLPRMVAEMEAQGRLKEFLYDAQEKTLDELMEIEEKLITEQGLTVQQAQDQAWEIVRERYILLPPEDEE